MRAARMVHKEIAAKLIAAGAQLDLQDKVRESGVAFGR